MTEKLPRGIEGLLPDAARATRTAQAVLDSGVTLPPATEPLTVRPLGDRILVKRIHGSNRTEGGLYVPGTSIEKPAEGTVIDVGEGKRNKRGVVIPLDVQIGDRILFGQYAGSDITVDDEPLLILREDEVLGVAEQTSVDFGGLPPEAWKGVMVIERMGGGE